MSEWPAWFDHSSQYQLARILSQFISNIVTAPLQFETGRGIIAARPLANASGFHVHPSESETQETRRVSEWPAWFVHSSQYQLARILSEFISNIVTAQLQLETGRGIIAARPLADASGFHDTRSESKPRKPDA